MSVANKTPRKLSHAEYTVAWICALPCELTAALAVLDEVHADLDNPPGDHNAYSYGEVSGHNVVFTCLPAGVYGTTSATRVGERLIRTFESITIPLMVGIGGGVPSSTNDIRLGDVVVSVPTTSPSCPAVVQHDYGKVVSDGQFVRTGTLNKPATVLLSAVAKLRSKHSLQLPLIDAIITSALQNERLREKGFAYPGSELDILFEAACQHAEEHQECFHCGSPWQVERPARINSSPAIFYGPIASGNSVIKNSKVRDDIAQPLGILCFEMEAAGLMDTLPCLVIRGICDYCDAHKTKPFQHYASLAAAAFAKELLSVVSKASPVRDEVHRLVLETLNFEAAGDRLMSIKPAHGDTCAWLLSDPVYNDWMDDDRLQNNHGILWVKGKPGTGKSTFMKYALEQASTDHIVLSFFFNARGKTDLEKSTVGLYRSFLFQLLKRYPDLEQSVDWFDQPSNIRRWNLDILQNTFVSAIKAVGKRPITCYIDALDESTEDEVRDMVDVFDSLGQLTASLDILLRVCYSSRYYPQISMKRGLELRLDQRDGHRSDLKKYIDSELYNCTGGTFADLKASILQKSAGIFLWVVLVLKMLRREIDSGRTHNLSNKLQQTPSKLNDLFRDIIFRDGDDLTEFLLCLQWLLHAERSLSVPEFYFGMLAGSTETTTVVWDSSDVTLKDMIRYVSSVSKGLAEPIGSDAKPENHNESVSVIKARLGLQDVMKVQFIHESVPEFLRKPAMMLEIWSGFAALNTGAGHERLRVCCYQYLDQVDFNPRHLSKSFCQSFTTHYETKTSEPPKLPYLVDKQYPFLRYAAGYILKHTEIALSHGVLQSEPVDAAYTQPWLEHCAMVHSLCFETPLASTFLLAVAVCCNYEALVASLSITRADSNVSDADHNTLLHHAAENGSVKIMRALITAGADVNSLNSRRQTPLVVLARKHGSCEAALVLIAAGVDVNAAARSGYTALHGATFRDDHAMVKLLLDAKANTSAINHRGTTALHVAKVDSTVRELIHAKADVNAADQGGATPLHAATKDSIVRLLISAKANVNATNKYGETPLHHVKIPSIAQQLVDAGADVNAVDIYGTTPLRNAMQFGRTEIVGVLVQANADITIKDYLNESLSRWEISGGS